MDKHIKDIDDESSLLAGAERLSIHEPLEKFEKSSDIDESFYSRQLYTLGRRGQLKLSKGHVLLLGVGGVGVEIAKNLVLAGVGQLSIRDRQTTRIEDLGCQFLLRETDVGKNRAEASRTPLSRLNGLVKVSVVEPDEDLEHYISSRKLDVVIVTDVGTAEAIPLSKFCHEHRIPFIYARDRGLFGQIFCDFGEEHTFLPKEAKSNTMNIMGLTGNLHLQISNDTEIDYGLEEVTLQNMKSFPFLNGKTFAIKNIKGNTLEICIDEMTGNKIGTANEYVSERSMTFKNLQDSLAKPDIVHNDCLKANYAHLLHLAFQVIDRLEKVKEDARTSCEHQIGYDQFTNLFSDILLESKVQLDLSETRLRELLKLFFGKSTGSLMPLVSIVGSIASQEAIKALTRMFLPIHQWMYFDALETVADEVADGSKEIQKKCDEPQNRYSNLSQIYGDGFLEMLKSKRIFIVGAGAIGCELLKNLVMLGVGLDNQIVVTDMDLIEKSNLNRQFLFSNNDIGLMKSSTAARSATDMNADYSGRIKADSNRLCQDTELMYDDKFFDGIHVAMGALDNVQARRYLDERCVLFDKPWIDSGTMGTECSVECVVPMVTDCYSSVGSGASVEKAIPLCTLKHFPTRIEHAIQWARDEFEGVFHNSILTCNRFLENRKQFLDAASNENTFEKLEELKYVKSLLSTPVKTGEDCISISLQKFRHYFCNNIKQLQHTFPENHKTKEGMPFWSGIKSYPKEIIFSPTQDLHLKFVHATAALTQKIFGVGNRQLTKDDVIDYVTRGDGCVATAEFKADDKREIPATEEEAKIMAARTVDAAEQKELISWLEARPVEMNDTMKPIQFEKDDDLHIAFVSSAANLRALNYNIATVDDLQVKAIAGKIIPAIATTTSLVAGLACIELLKLLSGRWKRENLKNWSVSTAGNSFVMCRPRQPKVHKILDKHVFTVWDKYRIDRDCTIKEIMEHVQEKHGVQVFTISIKQACLYSPLSSQERLSMKISEVIKEVLKRDVIKEKVRSVVCEVTAEDDLIEKLPHVVIQLF